jgi:hypothetical protein
MMVIFVIPVNSELANLAVADYDIVAVATVQSPEEVNVVACSHSDSNNESPLLPSPTVLSHYWNCNLIFSKNPRMDGERDDESKDCPVVVDAKALATKALAGLDGDEAKLRAHVESRR